MDVGPARVRGGRGCRGSAANRSGGGMRVLHLIAFVAIGLVFGGLVSWVTVCRSPALVVLAGLVGSVAAGEAFQSLIGSWPTGWASLFIAMVVGSIVAWLPTQHRLHEDAGEGGEAGHRPPSVGA
jgi:uncharacterized membrane protein YeaQ/YmgE (transglycosylase-associated protein family)